MGLDCEGFIEVDLDILRRRRPGDRTSWSLWGKVRLSRHAGLFGLFGFRTEGEPLFAPRGLPPDPSKRLSEELDTQMFPGQTWLAVHECREALERFNAEVPQMPADLTGQNAALWQSAEQTPRRELAGIIALMTELDAVYPGVRLILAFG